jgi:hypothetical protein
MNLQLLAIAVVVLAFSGGTLLGVCLGRELARKKRRKEDSLTPMLGVVLPPEKGN